MVDGTPRRDGGRICCKGKGGWIPGKGRKGRIPCARGAGFVARGGPATNELRLKDI